MSFAKFHSIDFANSNGFFPRFLVDQMDQTRGARVYKTSNRTRAYQRILCGDSSPRGDIEYSRFGGAPINPFVERNINFVAPTRNAVISRKILWYIPLYYCHQIQQQHAYQFSELADRGWNKPSISDLEYESSISGSNISAHKCKMLSTTSRVSLL